MQVRGFWELQKLRLTVRNGALFDHLKNYCGVQKSKATRDLRTRGSPTYSVSLASALPDARPDARALANDLGGLARHIFQAL